MIVQDIKTDIKTAMKAGDRDKAALLRLVIGTLQQENTETDEAAEKVIRKMIKSNNQTAEALVANGSSAMEVHQENALLNSYLPKSMTVQEIKNYLSGKIDVSENPGKVMGAAMKLFKDNNLNAQGSDVKQALQEMQSA